MPYVLTRMGLTGLHVLLTLLIDSPVEVRGPLFILPLPAQWALDIVLGKHLLPVLGNTGHASVRRDRHDQGGRKDET